MICVAVVVNAGCGDPECAPALPPCGDESLYELRRVASEAPPAGSAAVVSDGLNVHVRMLDGGEDVIFALPVLSSLESGEVVRVEPTDLGTNVYGADGQIAFFVGAESAFLVGAAGIAGLSYETTAVCEPPGADGCGGSVDVFAIRIDGTQVAPGETRTLELADGRGATVRNERINRGSNSCAGCLDLPPWSFRLDVVFH